MWNVLTYQILLFCYQVLTLWHQSWTFKFERTVYVECEYPMNQKI